MVAPDCPRAAREWLDNMIVDHLLMLCRVDSDEDLLVL
jgi:hypothetical protein